jgi:Phage tail sheath C-terminal domain
VPTPPFRPTGALTAAAAVGDKQVVMSLANAYAIGDVAGLGNTPVGATTFRLSSTAAIPAGALIAGTMLTFTQGGNNDSEIVGSVQTEQLGGGAVTYRVTLAVHLSRKVIQVGIRWAVFEPNNTQLWNKLKRSISAFLNQAWRDGALFGDKATDAYYVRIDEALNPFSEQQLGRLHIEIGVRPSYPAEFIIVRIGIWAGGSDVSET